MSYYKLQQINSESPSDNDVYYEILPEKKPLYIKILNLFTFPVIQPLRLIQFLFGRLFSYLILNPLFRAEEDENTFISKNIKYKDDFNDEIVVVDILPPDKGILKYIKNWIYHFNNYLFYSGKFIWDRGADKPLPPEQLYNHSRVAELIGVVVTLVTGKLLPGQFKDRIASSNAVGREFRLDQIHFRGLDSLPMDAKNAFFDNLSALGYNLEENQKKYLFHKLKTREGNELCSVEVRGNNIDFDIKNRNFIIFCCPRSNNYMQWLKQLRYLADNTNSTVVTCDYNGTGRSKGLVTRQTDLKNNALALCERLIALGADPKKITYFGESLGANVATQAAGHLNRLGFKVGLFNARSFTSLEAVILGKIFPEKHSTMYNPVNWVKTLLGIIVKYMVFPLLYLTDWDLNVTEDILSIPSENLDLTVVRSRKDEHGKRFMDDRFGHEASIYKFIRNRQKDIIKIKETQNATLTLEETKLYERDLNQCKFIVDHRFFKNPHKVNGHMVPAKCLRQRENPSNDIDARDYQISFFNRFFQRNASNLEGNFTFDNTSPLIDYVRLQNGQF